MRGVLGSAGRVYRLLPTLLRYTAGQPLATGHETSKHQSRCDIMQYFDCFFHLLRYAELLWSLTPCTRQSFR